MTDIDLTNLPSHIAITMDGNGRWATQRKLPRTAGHNEGLKTAKEIVRAASDLGIKNLTLYVFSTENWKRAETEVGFLMNLIHVHLKGELDFYKEHKIRINHIGNFDNLPENIKKDIAECMEATKDFAKLDSHGQHQGGMILNLAINYGGRDEIIRGIKKLYSKMDIKSEDCLHQLNEQLTEKSFSEFLDMPESPEVDLLIRTGGEQRLSNFLLWHVAYAEQIYSNTLWPDYTNEEFYSNIKTYQSRNRRFGAEK